MDQYTKLNLLYDFYGGLLTKRQKEVFSLYHEENLSLSEIGEEFSISRQAVHDALKSGEEALKNYEVTLGLVNKFNHTHNQIEKIDEIIDKLINENKEISSSLRDVKDIIDKINE